MGSNWHAARSALSWSLLLLLLAPAAALAQFGFNSEFELSDDVQVREPEGDTRTHLERVKALLEAEHWDEAIDTLSQIMETQGDRLIAIEPNRYLTVRDYCHLQIAQLPPPALQLYRDRVDPLARKWYEDGVAQRDPQLLTRVIEQVFCSSWGDSALVKLAELALERGHFAVARDYLEQTSPLLRTPHGRPLWLALQGVDLDARWQQLEPLLTKRDTPSLWLAYPDTDLDLAEVRARLALVSILEGSAERAQFDWELLRRLHPEAKGMLAGREVHYAEQLQQLLTTSATWPTPLPADDWLTFAGSPHRNTELPKASRLAMSPWDAPITLGSPVAADAGMAQNFGYGGRRPNEDSERLLSYHPLVVGNLLLVNNLTQIRAFDLQTGKSAWGHAEGVIYSGEQEGFGPQRHSHGRSRLGVPRFTMTVADGKLFARMGEPVTSSPQEPRQTMQPGYLVCLDLERQGQLLWKITPAANEAARSEAWAFEGSPVSDGNRVYVGLRRSDVRPQAYVACYDAQTGRQLWRQFICAAETPARGQVDEITTNLLTLAEGTLFYNTNLGAVVSLSAEDGQINWLSRYRRAGRGDLSRPANHFYRDLTPCVYYRGTVVAAPADSEYITAFDAGSGQQLWASKLPSDAVHLLGVRGDQLIASGNRLWWLDIHTGKVVRRWPESDKGGPHGYGRGILAGGELYWPTRDRIYIFDSVRGQQIEEPISLAIHGVAGGNLLIIRDFFLIAGSEQLYGISQRARQFRPPQPEVTDRSKSNTSFRSAVFNGPPVTIAPQ